MKKRAETLNDKVKCIGNECVLSTGADRVAVMAAALTALNRQAEAEGSFWLWAEAVKLLGLNQAQQLLAGMLWGYSFLQKKELSAELFWGICREVEIYCQETLTELPVWIYEADNTVVLSPVLTGWLEGTMPILPQGTSLYLTQREKCYGLDVLLEDAGRIFRAVEDSGQQGILCIEGEKGSGRSFCMGQICAQQELALLMLDGEHFRGLERELNAVLLCTLLYGAFVCVKLGSELREQLLTDLTGMLRFYGLIREEKRELAEQPDAVIYTRRIFRPDRALKYTAAQEVLGEWAEKLPSGVSLQQITGRQLPMGMYLRYLRNIRAELEAGTVCSDVIQIPSASGSLNLLPATRTFAELKLPAAQYEQLRRISRMISAREDVMSTWGFADKFTYGNGMSVLFYGAPGTGKTMAAQVLANELGMPLYRVDLSQLISKYIGETQKNIGRIFDEAEKCDCILLFDEADAIFTKRSDVSDAQDRYSNAETAYLLQRIEQYAGVSILATNLLQNFDEAFRRRISYMVHFPMPDVQLRTQLWEDIFPKATPVASEVDPLMLAQAFELSGASIKNAALHGALLARAQGSEVRMVHILDGIRNEYSKQGKSFSSSQRELLDAFQ